jgi:hypothetical protein
MPNRTVTPAPKSKSPKIKTQMLVDGVLVPANINKETGEISPKRKYTEREVKPRHNGLFPIPFWMFSSSSPFINKSPTLYLVTNSTKSLVNPYTAFLSQFFDCEQLIEEYPQVDNIFTGASWLCDGTRPFSKELLIRCLSSLPVITTHNIALLTAKKTRQCERIAACLRVIVRQLGTINFADIHNQPITNDFALYELLAQYQSIHNLCDEDLAYQFIEPLSRVLYLKNRYGFQNVA